MRVSHLKIILKNNPNFKIFNIEWFSKLLLFSRFKNERSIQEVFNIRYMNSQMSCLHLGKSINGLEKPSKL